MTGKNKNPIQINRKYGFINDSFNASNGCKWKYENK